MGSWILHGSKTGRLWRPDKRRLAGGRDSHVNRFTVDTRCHLHLRPLLYQGTVRRGPYFSSAPQGGFGLSLKRKQADWRRKSRGGVGVEGWGGLLIRISH